MADATCPQPQKETHTKIRPVLRAPLAVTAVAASVVGPVAPADALSACAGHGGSTYAGTSGPTVHIICFDGLELWI